MADKRQKWPQNEIMFQVTQYSAPPLKLRHWKTLLCSGVAGEGGGNFKFTAV